MRKVWRMAVIGAISWAIAGFESPAQAHDPGAGRQSNDGYGYRGAMGGYGSGHMMEPGYMTGPGYGMGPGSMGYGSGPGMTGYQDQPGDRGRRWCWRETDPSRGHGNNAPCAR